MSSNIKNKLIKIKLLIKNRFGEKQQLKTRIQALEKQNEILFNANMDLINKEKNEPLIKRYIHRDIKTADQVMCDFMAYIRRNFDSMMLQERTQNDPHFLFWLIRDYSDKCCHQEFERIMEINTDIWKD